MIESLLTALQLHRNEIAIGVPLLGGTLVVASSLLMRRGKAKGLLTGAYMFLAALGANCLIYAAFASITGSAREQTSPLWLLGIVLTVIMGIFTPAVIGEYQQHEFRKLAAEIFRRS